MESFNLNIIPGKDRPVCHASQYDIGRTFHVNLFEGFNVFTLDGTEVISISVRKPDGNVVTESVTNTSDSYVEFVTTEQMTACHGSNLCELKLEKGADVIGTMNFILEVEQDPLEGGVQSASEIDNLETQIAGMVATEVADQYDSANVIFDAAPTAGHGVPYTVTSEGIKGELDQKAEIDDVTPSASTVYSSDKVDTLLSAKQDVTDANLQTTATTIVGAINELNRGIQNIATVYNPAGTYNLGNIVLYQNILYKAKADNITGAWDASKWDEVTVSAEISNIVVKRTLTETTTANGNVVNYIDVTNGIIVAARCTSQEALVIPFLNSLGNQYSFHVMNPLSSHGVVSNTSVTIDFYMIPSRRIVDA